jgi:hypothetical protein
MRSPSAEHYALDGRSAHQAWFSGSHVDLVLELKEAFAAFGVDVV